MKNQLLKLGLVALLITGLGVGAAGIVAAQTDDATPTPTVTEEVVPEATDAVDEGTTDQTDDGSTPQEDTDSDDKGSGRGLCDKDGDGIPDHEEAGAETSALTF